MIFAQYDDMRPAVSDRAWPDWGSSGPQLPICGRVDYFADWGFGYTHTKEISKY